jgi:hypothetical protein
MLVVGDRIHQSQRMDAILRIKTVNQHRVGSAIFSDEFEFGIINDDVTVVFDAQLATHLQPSSFLPSSGDNTTTPLARIFDDY